MVPSSPGELVHMMKVIVQHLKKNPYKLEYDKNNIGHVVRGIHMKINDIKDDYQILIIGCGRLGASIANALSNRNKNVTIVDVNKDSFRKLSPSFSGLVYGR